MMNPSTPSFPMPSNPGSIPSSAPSIRKSFPPHSSSSSTLGQVIQALHLIPAQNSNLNQSHNQNGNSHPHPHPNLAQTNSRSSFTSNRFPVRCNMAVAPASAPPDCHSTRPSSGADGFLSSPTSCPPPFTFSVSNLDPRLAYHANGIYRVLLDIQKLKCEVEQLAKSFVELATHGDIVGQHISSLYTTRARPEPVTSFASAHASLLQESLNLFQSRFHTEILYRLDDWSEDAEEVLLELKNIQRTRMDLDSVQVQLEKLFTTRIEQQQKPSQQHQHHSHHSPSNSSHPKSLSVKELQQLDLDIDKTKDRLAELSTVYDGQRKGVQRSIRFLLDSRGELFHETMTNLMELEYKFFRDINGFAETFRKLYHIGAGRKRTTARKGRAGNSSELSSDSKKKEEKDSSEENSEDVDSEWEKEAVQWEQETLNHNEIASADQQNRLDPSSSVYPLLDEPERQPPNLNASSSSSATIPNDASASAIAVAACDSSIHPGLPLRPCKRSDSVATTASSSLSFSAPTSTVNSDVEDDPSSAISSDSFSACSSSSAISTPLLRSRSSHLRALSVDTTSYIDPHKPHGPRAVNPEHAQFQQRAIQLGLPMKKQVNPSRPMRPLPWDPIPLEEVKGSVWEKVLPGRGEDKGSIAGTEEGGEGEEVETEKYELKDLNGFEQSFKIRIRDRRRSLEEAALREATVAAEKQEREKQKKLKANRLNGKGIVTIEGQGGSDSLSRPLLSSNRLIGSKRSHIFADTLLRLRLTPRQIRFAIYYLNDRLLTPDRCHDLRKVYPTAKEEESIHHFVESGASPSNFSIAETFVFHLSYPNNLLPSLSTRFQCLEFMLEFNSLVTLLESNFNQLYECCKSICESDLWQGIFGNVLAIGNYLNSFNSVAQYGFRIELLLFLQEMKSNQFTPKASNTSANTSAGGSMSASTSPVAAPAVYRPPTLLHWLVVLLYRYYPHICDSIRSHLALIDACVNLDEEWQFCMEKHLEEGIEKMEQMLAEETEEQQQTNEMEIKAMEGEDEEEDLARKAEEADEECDSEDRPLSTFSSSTSSPLCSLPIALSSSRRSYSIGGPIPKRIHRFLDYAKQRTAALKRNKKKAYEEVKKMCQYLCVKKEEKKNSEDGPRQRAGYSSPQNAVSALLDAEASVPYDWHVCLSILSSFLHSVSSLVDEHHYAQLQSEQQRGRFFVNLTLERARANEESEMAALREQAKALVDEQQKKIIENHINNQHQQQQHANDSSSSFPSSSSSASQPSRDRISRSLSLSLPSEFQSLKNLFSSNTSTAGKSGVPGPMTGAYLAGTSADANGSSTRVAQNSTNAPFRTKRQPFATHFRGGQHMLPTRTERTQLVACTPSHAQLQIESRKSDGINIGTGLGSIKSSTTGSSATKLPRGWIYTPVRGEVRQ